MNKLNSIIEKYGIEKLNTLTKYPSIMTYHNLGDRGCLAESFVDDKDFSSVDECYITEKIDGTNARIIYADGDYIIGSREELLFAKGDRIVNPQLNIVNTIKNMADKLMFGPDGIVVLYGEVYGGNVTKSSKEYTDRKTLGFRMFDIADIADFSILEQPIENISSWREHGGQKFNDVNVVLDFCQYHNFDVVPYLSVIKGNEMPKDRLSTFKFLKNFSETKAGIDNHGKAEGIVVRNLDRSIIRKIRFEDYEKTAKRESWKI